MNRATRFVPVLCTSTLLASCALAGSGPQVTPTASGLVGEWISPVTRGQADTTVWRFAPDGKSVQVRIRYSRKPKDVPFGSFRVYADTGRLQLMCFDFRRGRALPACRYFQVDTLSDASGRMHRQLQLFNWVGEKRKGAEIWSEKAP